MKEIQKQAKERIETYDEVCRLTKEELEIIRAVSRRPRNPERKTSYPTWDCALCGFRCFYRVRRCLACESETVKQVDNAVKS